MVQWQNYEFAQMIRPQARCVPFSIMSNVVCIGVTYRVYAPSHVIIQHKSYLKRLLYSGVVQMILSSGDSHDAQRMSL
jgi:hypothetical protein